MYWCGFIIVLCSGGTYDLRTVTLNRWEGILSFSELAFLLILIRIYSDEVDSFIVN